MDYDLSLPEGREKARQKALKRLARGREVFGVLLGVCLSFVWVILSHGDWRSGLDYNALAEAALPLLGAVVSGFGWYVFKRRTAQYALTEELLTPPAVTEQQGVKPSSQPEFTETLARPSVQEVAPLVQEPAPPSQEPAWAALVMTIGTLLFVLCCIFIFLPGFIYMVFTVGTFLPSREAEHFARLIAAMVAIAFLFRAVARWRGWIAMPVSPSVKKSQWLFEPLFMAAISPFLFYFLTVNGSLAAVNAAIGYPQNMRMQVIRYTPDECVSIPRLDEQPVFCTGGIGFPAGQSMRIDVVLKTSLFGVDVVGAEVDGVFIKNLHRTGSKVRQK